MEQIFESRLNTLTIEELELLPEPSLSPLMDKIYNCNKKEIQDISTYLANRDSADKNIKKKILEEGLTFKFVSVHLGISIPTLNLYLNGYKRMPEEMMRKLNILLQ